MAAAILHEDGEPLQQAAWACAAPAPAAAFFVLHTCAHAALVQGLPLTCAASHSLLLRRYKAHFRWHHYTSRLEEGTEMPEGARAQPGWQRGQRWGGVRSARAAFARTTAALTSHCAHPLAAGMPAQHSTVPAAALAAPIPCNQGGCKHGVIAPTHVRCLLCPRPRAPACLCCLQARRPALPSPLPSCKCWPPSTGWRPAAWTGRATCCRCAGSGSAPAATMLAGWLGWQGRPAADCHAVLSPPLSPWH